MAIKDLVRAIADVRDIVPNAAFKNSLAAMVRRMTDQGLLLHDHATRSYRLAPKSASDATGQT